MNGFWCYVEIMYMLLWNLYISLLLLAEVGRRDFVHRIISNKRNGRMNVWGSLLAVLILNTSRELRGYTVLCRKGSIFRMKKTRV